MPLWTGAGLAVVGIAGVTLFAGTLRPELARMRTLKPFASQVRRQIGDAPLHVAGGINYELSFYYGQAAPVWDEGFGPARIGSAPVYVALSEQEFTRLGVAGQTRLRLMIRGDNSGGAGRMSLYEVEPSGGLR